MFLRNNFLNSKQVQHNQLIDNTFPFPPNLAQRWPKELLARIFAYIHKNYVTPYTRDRRDFEEKWDKLLEMYKISATNTELRLPHTEKTDDLMAKVATILLKSGNNTSKAQVSDSMIFDAVDRLKNLDYFIGWKDGTPVQYNIPKNRRSLEDEFYHPLEAKLESANGLLDWNIKQQNIPLKYLKAKQHYYLYGLVFILSDFEIEMEIKQRRRSDGSIMERWEIEKAGVSFEPMSCRRVWLDYTIPLDEMHRQPCPFFFRDMHMFEVMQNLYDHKSNPFGYVNIDQLSEADQYYSSELASWRKGFPSEPTTNSEGRSAMWTFYAQLPLDPLTGEFDDDHTRGIPFKRFTCEWYGANLNGYPIPVRLQEWYHPGKELPLYGASHIPDLDSGAYTPSVADLLQNHYYEVTTCMNQFIDNKNLINDPPSWCMVGSPAANKDRNAPGAKLETTGPNDFGWRQIPDATISTLGILQHLRQQGQTTSKSVDAILGKAMGARTTATEASNAFQSAMSGVTTDIDTSNGAIMGGYGLRVWSYCGLWFDTDLLKEITGQYGEPLTPEDMWLAVDIKTDVGSTFVESVVKQQHLRYALEAGTRSPNLKQDVLWKAFFKELRLHEALPAVMDAGFERQVTLAHDQAINTYLGRPVALDPGQDHQVAMEVKTRFLQDHNSSWNKEYAGLPGSMLAPGTNIPLSRAQELAFQISIHQQFVAIQIAQMQMQQQEMMEQQLLLEGKHPSQQSNNENNQSSS